MKFSLSTAGFCCLVLILSLTSYSQDRSFTSVYTSDVDNFWIAFDSIITSDDKEKQLSFIRTLYIEKGTQGLKAFIKERDYTAEEYISLINKYPRFWKSVRANTLMIKSQFPRIEKGIEKFRDLYPDCKPAGIYFTIGALRSAGTTKSEMVLISTEMVAADSGTDASELSNWLKTLFKGQTSGDIVGMNIHEYVHTQQSASGSTLLGKCLEEGSADFIAELATRQKNLNDYMLYGQRNESSLKRRFRFEMYRRSSVNWLYNGEKAEHADLGYFMGYAICKAYYDKAADKKKAVKEIIELDYSNKEAITAFLEKSGYYNNPNLRSQ
ncbi:MAG TPA: hypothetical protein VK625_14100 [Flavitalea sp.]|nr:hypothetical protein [Flavitalea sp.]